MELHSKLGLDIILEVLIITWDKNGENVSYLEINEVALVHCNIANKEYLQNSRVLCTVISN